MGRANSWSYHLGYTVVSDLLLAGYCYLAKIGPFLNIDSKATVHIDWQTI